MPAMQTCARCSSNHATAVCPYPFYRKMCPNCGKTCSDVQPGAPICILVKEQRKAARAQKYEEWKQKDSAYRGLQEAKEQKRKQFGSDASSDAASTCAETVDVPFACGGILALSPLEEKEARKIEKKLREIACLQKELDQGNILDKLQREKIHSKEALESHLVMQKIRAGARRPSL